MCQPQSRLWIVEAHIGSPGGLDKGRQQDHAYGPEFCCWLGYSAVHTAGWPERVVAKAGLEGKPTSCFLPLHICVQRVVGQREQSRACPDEQEPTCFLWGIQRERRCLVCRNQESRKKTPTWKAGGRQASPSAPTWEQGIPLGLQSIEDRRGWKALLEREGPGVGQKLTLPLPELSLYQPFMSGTCYLEIKLFYTSTCLAKQNGGRQGPCLVPCCLPIIF